MHKRTGFIHVETKRLGHYGRTTLIYMSFFFPPCKDACRLYLGIRSYGSFRISTYGHLAHLLKSPSLPSCMGGDCSHEARRVMTPVRWCQARNYDGRRWSLDIMEPPHQKYTNAGARCAASSKSVRFPEIAPDWGPLNNSMSFFLPPLPLPLPLLLQKGLEEQLMRADEYLMAPSLLDKPGLRDDKLRGIKQRRGEWRGGGVRSEGSRK